ncbi:MAG: hypothetical protein ABWX90_00875 [Candidatus Saccharimonadales bacterium]
MTLQIGSLYWLTEIEQLQPVRDRVTKRLRSSKRKPKVLSRRLVMVTEGQYLSNGRVSNFWYWKYFDASNQFLTNEVGHGYPNGAPYVFEPAEEFDIKIEAIKKAA